jgi:hypothetical protein
MTGLILLISVSLAAGADLSFTEANNFTENGSFIVLGFVRNTSTYTMKDITITIRYYDKEGKFLRFATTPANPSTLSPGEEASYRVAIPENKQIASIKKTARWAVQGGE